MLKSKMLIKVLVVLIILFWFHPINNSIAGSCDENSSSGGTSTCTGNFNIPSNWNCPENPTLEYDTVNSQKTIDRNGSANLVVIGNSGPYSWSVSGTGFTLETEGDPTGPTNTLYADGSACGTATITVTGCSGPPVTGYVRCTTGGWGDWQDGCVLSGEPDSQSCYFAPPYYCDYYKTAGKYQQNQQIGLDPYCFHQNQTSECLSPYQCADILGSAWQNCGSFLCCFESHKVCLYNRQILYREWMCPP